MEQINVTSLVDKLKGFVQQNTKLVIGVAVAVVVAIGGYNYWQAQPKSVASVVEVTFSGYDGYGTLEYNYDDLSNQIKTVAYRSAGFNAEQAEALINDDALMLSELYANPKLSSNYRKAQAILETVSYEFDKTTELNNGDTVVFTIKTTSKQSPIKSETKSFTVKGLKEVEEISKKALLKEYPVTFVGFNGQGKIELPQFENDGYDSNVFESINNESGYKNGDKVKLTASSAYLSYLQENGQKLESKTVEVTVSGLKEFTDISNISTALSKNDTYIKSRYENTSSTTYKIEKQKDFISYQAEYSSSGQIYLVSVYKVTRESEYSDTTVKYVYYGYRYYVKSDGSLDLETANTISGYETQDYENLIAGLKTEGYTEYSSDEE